MERRRVIMDPTTTKGTIKDLAEEVGNRIEEIEHATYGQEEEAVKGR